MRRLTHVCAEFERKKHEICKIVRRPQGRIALADIDIEFTATDYVQSAAPLDFSVTFSASQVAFMRAPAGWASEFHVSSARNMFVVLSGEWEVLRAMANRVISRPAARCWWKT